MMQKEDMQAQALILEHDLLLTLLPFPEEITAEQHLLKEAS